MIDQLDFNGVAVADACAARAAIAGGENFFGYLPSAGFDFIVRNFRALAALGALEAAWLDAYVHTSHFGGVRVDTLRAIFDACNRDAFWPSDHSATQSRLREMGGSRCFAGAQV